MEQMWKCPFHDDDKESLSVNLVKGVYYCHACKAKGSISDLQEQAQQKVQKTVGIKIDEDKIDDMHRALLKNPTALELSGLNIKTAKKYKLGLRGDRLIFPVWDEEQAAWVNLRKYKQGADTYKLLNEVGGKARMLYPESVLIESDTVYLVEGEKDALRGLQEGMPCITTTCGCNTWDNSFTEKLKNKQVIVCYDVDEAGREAANKIAKTLGAKILALPLDTKEFPKGDLTDYFDNGGSVKELMKVPLVEPADAEIEVIALCDVMPSKTAGTVRTRAVIEAKAKNPVLIPIRIEAHCSREHKQCVNCPLNNGKSRLLDIDPTSPKVLGIIETKRGGAAAIYRGMYGIPTTRCDVSFKEVDFVEGEWCMIHSPIQLGADTEVAVRRDLLNVSGHEARMNITYDIDLTILPDKDRSMILFGTELKPCSDNLEEFRESFNHSDHKALTVFQAGGGIDEKLEDIYHHLEHITGICGRRDEHLMADLVYHSVLRLPPLNGSALLRGWVEALMIGDPAVGKTELLRGLRNHYGLGSKIDAAMATVAGLVGGLQRTDKGFHYTLGALPLSDRRLVVLEEVGNLDPEVMKPLRDMRTEGYVQLTKIEKFGAHARVRQIWTANPRMSMSVAQHRSGVKLIEGVIDAQGDIRRFHIATIMAEQEVTSEQIAQWRKEPYDAESNPYTASLCNALVQWAWTRTHEDVLLTEELRDSINEHAIALSRRYHPSLPLVCAGDMSGKLFALATSLACRLYSTPDGVRVEVTPEHVGYVVALLDRLYSREFFGYDVYSAQQFTISTISDAAKKELDELFYGVEFGDILVATLLNSPWVSRDDIAEICGFGGPQSTETSMVVSVMRRANAIYPSRVKNKYNKTEGFNHYLREFVGESSPLLPRDFGGEV